MKALTTVTLLALIVLAGPTAPARSEALPKGYCIATAQGVTQLKGISCRGAKKVLKAYYRADLPRRPECRGQGSIRWRGWKVTGAGKIGIATRFTRPGRSFLASGGGTC